MPRRMRSSARLSTCPCSSSLRLLSHSLRWNNACQRCRMRANTLRLLRPGRKCRGHAGGCPAPAGSFLAKALLPRNGELVVFCPAVALRRSPFRLEHSSELQFVECRVERSLLDRECSAGHLLDAEQHAIAVDGPERDCLQNQEVERTAQKISLFRHYVS